MTPNTNFNTKYQGIVFITYFRTSSSVFQVPLLIGGHLIFRLTFLTTTSSVCRLCFAFVAVLFVLGIEEKCFLRHHLWKRYSLKIYFDFSEIKTGWRQFIRIQQSKRGFKKKPFSKKRKLCNAFATFNSLILQEGYIIVVIYRLN